MYGLAFLIVLGLSLVFYGLGRARAVQVAGGDLSSLHSRPTFHGMLALILVLMVGWSVLLIIGIGWNVLNTASLMRDIRAALPEAPTIEHQLVLSDAKALAEGRLASRTDLVREEIAQRFAGMDQLRLWGSVILGLGAATAAGLFSLSRVAPDFRARNRAEKIIQMILWAMAAIAVLTTIGIVFSLIFETIGFFQNIGWRIDKFVLGTTWSPLSGVQSGAISADKVGAVPLFLGTFLITLIAMLVAVPIGLFAAIYLSDFASRRVRSIVKPMLEVLAGIPTVVYGFFAAITMAPFFRNTGEALGISIASESALAAGVVMGIMIIPFISSLSDDVINAVPQSLRDGSYGLGATKAETIRQVVLPAALPGIVSAVLLGVSRAVGETMIVVMAAGQGANLTLNPFEAVTTVTVQIVMLITGDTEAAVAAGPAFTLGFTLFCVTLLMNVIAQRIVRKYREAYD